MFTFLVVIATLGGIAYRVTTASERQLLWQKLAPVLDVISRTVAESAGFRAALKARTPWLLVTPAVATVHIVLFVRMVVGDTALGEQTLLAWGATQGTRTAAGEWWRLVSATFLQTSAFQLLVALVVIGQVGALIERLIGPLTFVCAYLAAGALGSTMMMSADVTTVYAGGSAALFALYGVLFAASIWATVRPSAPVAVPMAQYRLLAPAASVLVLTSVMTSGLANAHNIAGIVVGVIVGLAGAMKASHHRITFIPVAWATVVALIAVTYVAVPVQSWIRVRDQLANLVVIEHGTTDTYREVLRKFTNGRKRVDTKALTELIDGSIVPQLSRAAADISEAGAVTPEHRALVVSAREYLRLREASWRLRAEGLKKGNIRLLQQADSMEQSSMEALRPLKELKPDRPDQGAVSDGS